MPAPGEWTPAQHYAAPPERLAPGRRWQLCKHPECVARRQQKARRARAAGQPKIDPGWYTVAAGDPEARLCLDHRQTATTAERAALGMGTVL